MIVPKRTGVGARILIVAPNASSRFGGEAFLPLKYFQVMRRRGVPVTLIAHARNREDLSIVLDPMGDDVLFVEDSSWHKIAWLLGQRLPASIRDIIVGPLLSWINEHYQGQIIRKLAAAGQVSLIHQPTPVSPLTPTGLHRFGLPLVVGPMNGGMRYPGGYEDMQSRLAGRFVELGRLAARVLNLAIPGKRKATVLLVANERTRAALPFPDHSAIISLPENGVDLTVWKSGSRPGQSEPGVIRLVFSGRLVRWKAVDITLHAVNIAIKKGISCQLDVLGDGPERSRLEGLCSALGIADRVAFHGFVPQIDCVAHFAAADALILNSVWECGGAVVLEAMAMGLPVIGPDWGGPADYIDSDCGLLVSPTPRASYAERLAVAIETLAKDPILRNAMGVAGANKVRNHYDWEVKVARMQEIYALALNSPSR